MENDFIPELRFPEFQKEWVEKKLSDLFTFKNGVNASKEDYGSGYKFINVLDIIQNDYITNDRIIGLVNISESEFNKNIVKYGDILFQRSSETRKEVGQANVYLDKELPATFGGFVIRGTKKIEYDPSFMNALLKTSRSRKEITSKSGGSTRYNVGQDTLSEVVIFTTEPKEQTKIATFLMAIDKRIQILQKKKAELEQYKKGVMQKLFSRTIRFKKDDGSNFPDWEEKRLGQIGVFQTSSIDKLSKDDEKLVYLVNYMNVYRHENITNLNRYKLQIVSAKDNQIVSSNLLKGDILFTPSSETPSDIGHSVVVFEDLENTVFSYHLMRFRPSIKLDLLYSHYFCNIPQVLKQLSRFATGSTRFTISVGNFSKIKVQLPSFEEQQKIANFLLTIDQSIEKLDAQIEDSVVFKQGLLQKMFV